MRWLSSRLFPLALKGVAYRAIGAGALLRRNLLVYGLGGIIIPFAGIKLIDMAVTAIGMGCKENEIMLKEIRPAIVLLVGLTADYRSCLSSGHDRGLRAHSFRPNPVAA